jgi:hypothetical protein
MHLVLCTAPTEPLDSAPRTALLQGADEAGSWDGFWSRSSDAYYARCTALDGRIEWYRMDDDVGAAPDADTVAPFTRVLSFRGDGMRRVAVVVAASPSGRQMLVGTARRVAR